MERFDVPTRGAQQAHTWVVGEDYVICLTREGTISDEVWSRFCRDAGAPNIRAILGLSYENVSLTSVQRKAVSSAIQGKMLGAVLDSVIVRGVLTALGWFGANVKSFAWRELDDAIEYTLPAGVNVSAVRKVIDDLLRRSGAPSLAQLAR